MFVGATLGGRLASLDALSLVWQASWIVQLVILVLVVLSIMSWTIIAFKWRELRRAEQDSEAFLQVYHEGSLDAAYEAARDLDGVLRRGRANLQPKPFVHDKPVH